MIPINLNINPLQKFREGIDSSSSSILKTVSKIANAEIIPWAIRGASAAVAILIGRIGYPGIAASVLGRELAQQINQAQRPFFKQSIHQLGRQLNENVALLTSVIISVTSATAAMVGYGIAHESITRLTPEPTPQESSLQPPFQLVTFGLLALDLANHAERLTPPNQSPLQSIAGSLAGASVVLGTGVLGGPAPAIAVGIALTAVISSQLSKMKPSRIGPEAIRNFYRTIAANYFKSIPEDQRAAAKEEIKETDPEAINKISRQLIDQLIRCPEDVSTENIPPSLHKKVQRIRHLQLQFRQMENQPHFSLSDDRAPAEEKAILLWREGRKLAAELILSGKEFVTEMMRFINF